MIRVWVIALVYLCFAFVVERGMLPQAMTVMPRESGGYADLPLLALAGLLIGVMSGELAGLGVAIVAAMLAGFSQSPGYLGASLVSFAVPAFIAGKLSRHFRFQS